jgi:GMP synthase-like glutamine amidotransferase
MRDRPLPPDYAQILAVDEKGRPALFQIGTNAFGFSGHPGVKSAIAEDLIMEFEDVPKNAKNALSALKTYREKIEDSLVKIMAGLVKETGLMQIQTSN